MPDLSDRIIGRKAIARIFEQMYDINSWLGALKFIRCHKLPLRRTPSNRPMFLKHELIQYDAKYQELLS